MTMRIGFGAIAIHTGSCEPTAIPRDTYSYPQFADEKTEDRAWPLKSSLMLLSLSLPIAENVDADTYIIVS